MSKAAKRLKSPFPYFGGKGLVAARVWGFIGDCDNVIEPFCGSAAFLLARPHPPRVETLNDADCMVANFWRATQHDPESVAAFADSPVNEADLHARHKWLVLSDDAAEFRRRMRSEPDYYDAKVAGWWCWGACCWIGSGWCGIGADWVQTPLSASGLTGVCATSQAMPRPKARHGQPDMPGVLNPNTGDTRRPQLADAFDIGRGVNSNGTLGTCAERRAWLLEWFGRLRDRLRLTRVCCGDWRRVCDSESVTTRLGTTGIFFDPPYGDAAGRDMSLYTVESGTVAADVRAYCLERGSNPMYRIVLCGYAGEGHEELEAHGWGVEAWQSPGGYGNRSDRGKANAKKERLWTSPHCRKSSGLFGTIV